MSEKKTLQERLADLRRRKYGIDPLNPLDRDLARKPTDWSLLKEFGFPLSGSLGPESPEDEMRGVKVPKLPKVVHWRNGRWGVVAGPFPERFFRTETRDTWQKAAKLYADTAAGRGATTREDQYAKVRLEDILEIETENEWGPVSP